MTVVPDAKCDLELELALSHGPLLAVVFEDRLLLLEGLLVMGDRRSRVADAQITDGRVGEVGLDRNCLEDSENSG